VLSLSEPQYCPSELHAQLASYRHDPGLATSRYIISAHTISAISTWVRTIRVITTSKTRAICYRKYILRLGGFAQDQKPDEQIYTTAESGHECIPQTAEQERFAALEDAQPLTSKSSRMFAAALRDTERRSHRVLDAGGKGQDILLGPTQPSLAASRPA
jgi:hypothetical protein